MPKILPQKFYNRDTLKVAQDLLGKFLIRKIGNKQLVGMITETEGYCGSNDLASHASKGKTPRTEIMFGNPGYSYIYLIYGMYNCLNIVTEHKNYPAAVLIRSIEPIEGIEYMKKQRKTDNELNLTTGPGKLCQAFQIDKKLNNKAVFKKGLIWVEDRGNLKSSQIIKAKRVGIYYAKEYRDKLWRFYIKDNIYISKK